MRPQPATIRLFIQVVLFLLTILTTTLAGAEWIEGKSFWFSSGAMGWDEFIAGFYFSIPFLGFLTTHEFGHFFMAKAKRIKVTLPYYIPFYIGILTSIGTLGAFIRIKSKRMSRKDYFDVGYAGPLAGFVVAVSVLLWGFTHLPTWEYVMQIHPEYIPFGPHYGEFVYTQKDASEFVRLGDNLLFYLLRTYLADPALMPHPNEVIHYPFLLAGYLGLFFTALNLIPIGQLDGGHILYGLIGKKAFDIVSPIFFVSLVFYSGLGLFSIEEFMTIADEEYLGLVGQFILYVYFIYLSFSRITSFPITNLLITLIVVISQVILNYFLPNWEGYSGFLAFAFLLGRVMGIYHPSTTNDQPLGLGRQIIGWLSLGIFVLCFSPNPLY